MQIPTDSYSWEPGAPSWLPWSLLLAGSACGITGRLWSIFGDHGSRGGLVALLAFILVAPLLLGTGFVTALERQEGRLSLPALLNLVGLIIAMISVIPFLIGWVG